MEISSSYTAQAKNSRNFEARVGAFSRNLTIIDGKIISFGWADEQTAGGISSHDLEVTHERGCMATIDFIRLNNVKEFYGIKDTLSEGRMKEHCLDIMA